MRRKYDRKLWGEIITGNYEEKLSQEIRGEASTDHQLGEGLGWR